MVKQLSALTMTDLAPLSMFCELELSPSKMQCYSRSSGDIQHKLNLTLVQKQNISLYSERTLSLCFVRVKTSKKKDSPSIQISTHSQSLL